MEFLNNIYRSTVTPDEDGVYRGTGFTAAILKPFVDEQSIESGRQQAAVKRTITAAGEDPADYNLGPGATTFDAQGAIVSERRERERQTKETDRKNNVQDTLTLTREQQAPQLEEMRATNARLLQQGQQQHQLALMQMADNKETRAAELEYQRMRDRKADLQYNERMAQLDRKDRQMAMQSLAAGLASLGAAFAM